MNQNHVAAKGRRSNPPKRKILISELRLTRLVQEDHPNAIAICHPNEEPYYVAPLTHDDPDGYQVVPKWTNFEFPSFPVPLDDTGAPWEPGILFILLKLEEEPYPNMGTYANQAADLAFYCQVLKQQNVDWMVFGKNKLLRPTYRFRGALNTLIGENRISRALAARCMSNVVAMYRRFINEGVLVPKYQPWEERDRYITFEDKVGRARTIKVKSTDVAISAGASENDDDFIYDGEKMKPLLLAEQELLFSALRVCANPEYTLLHLSAAVKVVVEADERGLTDIASGQCARPGTPIPISVEVPVEVACGKGEGCMFCISYRIHADKEDARKILSCRQYIDFISVLATSKEQFDQVFSKIFARMDELLGFMDERSPGLVAKVRDEVEEGNLTPFWQGKIEMLQTCGVI